MTPMAALMADGDDRKVRRAIESLSGRYADAGLDRDDLRQLGEIAAWRTAGRDVGIRIAAVRAAMLNERRAAATWRASRAAAALRPGSGRGFMTGTECVDLWLDVESALADRPALANAIDARFRLGMSHAEVGRATGCEPDAARKRLGSALAALRAALGPSYGDEYGRSVPMRHPERWGVKARRPGGRHAPRRRPKTNTASAAWAVKIRLIEDGRLAERRANETR